MNFTIQKRHIIAFIRRFWRKLEAFKAWKAFLFRWV